MHGWEELARTISRIYVALPAGELRRSRRARVLRVALSAARVISPHNNYWYWGPGPEGGTLLVVTGGRREDMDAAFEQVEEVGRTSCRYCMPYENDRPIRVGRGWKVRLSDVWKSEREFI